MYELNDRKTFVVEGRGKKEWGVYSVVATGFGGPAKNFMISYPKKELAEAFADGARCIEALRTAQPVKRFSVDEMFRRLDGQVFGEGNQ